MRRARFRSSGGILGLNIGKNAATPIERAVDDYLIGLAGVYPHADYVTVNISSPNTKNLRDLQADAALDALLGAIRMRRGELAAEHGRAVPIFLKIAPDLDAGQVEAIAATLTKHAIDGVIATNTTLARDAVAHLPHGDEAGGLSGAPLLAASNRVVSRLRAALGPTFPIIGVGGVTSPGDAIAKRDAGADIVQIYTGFIYKGPELVTRGRARPGGPSARETGLMAGAIGRRFALLSRLLPALALAALAGCNSLPVITPDMARVDPESVQFKTASGRILSPEASQGGARAPRRRRPEPRQPGASPGARAGDFRHAAQPRQSCRPARGRARTPTPPCSRRSRRRATTSTWRPTSSRTTRSASASPTRSSPSEPQGVQVNLIHDSVGTRRHAEGVLPAPRRTPASPCSSSTRSIRSRPRRAGK